MDIEAERKVHNGGEDLHQGDKVPGTEYLVDHGLAVEGQRILVPQPSNDPSDPLTWNRYWKASVTVSATLCSVAQAFSSLAIAPMFPQLAEEFNSDLSSVVQFTGVSILVLGFSNFLWIPLSSTFGRRPVLLASTLVSLASCIWRAEARSYNSFMGASILNGIGAGPCETLQPQIITDYVFLHDRGKFNALYFSMFFGSLNLAPVVAGLLAQHSSWRNFWWLNVAMLGFALVISVFAFPETRWHRSKDSDILSQPFDTDSSGTPTADSKQLSVHELRTSSMASGEASTFQGHPRKEQFNFYHIPSNPFQSLLRDFIAPFELFAFPIICFAAFVVSWSASCFLIVNLTQSQAFSEPPYNYGPQTVGLFNLAVVAGQLVGLASAGPLIDSISMRLTKRNNGIQESEMRLPAIIPYALIMLLGNFVVGFGYQYGWDWRAIVIVGYGCAGVQAAALPAIASTYAIDSYKPATGSIFVTITVVKNLWGYGLSRFVTDWSTADGFLAPIMTNMCLTALWCLLAIIFWWKGKTFRYWTRHSSVHSSM